MMNSNALVRSEKNRKYYTTSDILFFVALFTLKLVVHSSALQSDADETSLFGLGLGAINNIETHDGVMLKWKPIVDSRTNVIRNQNPYYYPNNKAYLHYSTQASKAGFYAIQPQFYQNFQPRSAFIRHPVQGKPPPSSSLQPQNIGSRGDFVDTPNRTTPPPSLWHESNPENFDFSQYDNPQPNAVTDRPPARQNGARGPFPATTPPKLGTPRKVSNCVWAIVNCCSQTDNKIRYNCFEEFNCHGAFWDVNPCSDKIRNNANSYLDKVYD